MFDGTAIFSDGTASLAAAPAWELLDEPLQLALAEAALRRAAASIARQAETLAREMEAGRMEDRGGPEALRLLAIVARLSGETGSAAGQAGAVLVGARR